MFITIFLLYGTSQSQDSRCKRGTVVISLFFYVSCSLDEYLMLYSYAIFMLLKVMLDCSISLQDSMLFNCHTSVVIGYVILWYLTASMFKYVSSSKTEPEDKGLLSLSMASLNRTGGEGPVNTTCTAGYVWCFTYN